MDATIIGLTTDQAHYIADSIDIDAARVIVDGGQVVVILSPEGLAELAALPPQFAGHFDGRHVWIGGLEYEVRRYD